MHRSNFHSSPISNFVGLWKGIIKPVALAGLVFSALAGFVHWIMVGPNEVQPEG